MNPDSTLAVTNTCPKDGVHLWRPAQIAPRASKSTGAGSTPLRAPNVPVYEPPGQPLTEPEIRSRIVPITPALWNVRPEATDRDLLVQAVAFSGFQLPISADSLYRPGDFVFVAYAGKKEIELVTINISAALTQYPQSCAIHGDAERVVVANAVGRCPWCGGKADQFKRPLQHSRSIIFCGKGSAEVCQRDLVPEGFMWALK